MLQAIVCLWFAEFCVGWVGLRATRHKLGYSYSLIIDVAALGPVGDMLKRQDAPRPRFHLEGVLHFQRTDKWGAIRWNGKVRASDNYMYECEKWEIDMRE
ncbi:hypothetical protein EDB19DRAFT_1753756, partial [Suillus lakei]